MEKRKLPSFVSMLVLTLITVVMWASFEVYRLFNKPVTPSVPANVSAPLTPSLDQTTISQIESRLFLDDSQIPVNISGSTTAAPPEPSPTPEATPENSPIPAPENASGSGTGT